MTGGHRAPTFPGSTLDAAARRGFQPQLASCSYDGGELEQGGGGEAGPQNGFYPLFKEHKTILALGEGLRRKEFSGSSEAWWGILLAPYRRRKLSLHFFENFCSGHCLLLQLGIWSR